MSVQSYIPDNAAGNTAGNETISMTASAIAHTRAQLAREGAIGLRLAVKPSGCSGFMYVLDLVREESPDERKFVFGSDTDSGGNNGVAVFVDTAALAMLNGTEVDYVQEGLNSLYKFRNPNVTGECGCGESFTIK